MRQTGRLGILRRLNEPADSELDVPQRSMLFGVFHSVLITIICPRRELLGLNRTGRKWVGRYSGSPGMGNPHGIS